MQSAQLRRLDRPRNFALGKLSFRAFYAAIYDFLSQTASCAMVSSGTSLFAHSERLACAVIAGSSSHTLNVHA